jgi:hypothetical protein
VLEDVPMHAVDPTRPRNPVLVQPTRPGPVVLATVLLYAAAGLGLLCAAALFAAAGWVPAGIRDRAGSTGASAADIEAIVSSARTALSVSATITLALAVATAVVATTLRGGGRGAARIGAFAVVAAGIFCGLGSTSYTAFGAHVDWTVAAGDRTDLLASQMGQAYGQAMPGWLVGLSGGLTDLQVLGYLAVAILLSVPAVRPYFRRPSK